MSKRHLITVAFLAVTLGLGGCASLEKADSKSDPAATIVEGPDGTRVTLSDVGARRLGITTQPAQLAPDGKSLVIPFAAVVYDVEGKAWAFTNPEGLTYVRAPITISTIDGDRAVLSAGPVVGTKVVTVGAAELVGAEAELGA